MKKLIVLFCSVLFVGSVLVSNAQANEEEALRGSEKEGKFKIFCPKFKMKANGILVTSFLGSKTFYPTGKKKAKKFPNGIELGTACATADITKEVEEPEED